MPRWARRWTVHPVYIFPLVFAGGIYFSATGPGWFEDLFVDKALPWLIPAWIGAGFSFAWEVLAEGMTKDGTPPGVVAATGIGSALVIAGMLGWGTLMNDPNLLAVAVFPGLRLAEPWLRSLGTRRAKPGTSAARQEDDAKAPPV